MSAPSSTSQIRGLQARISLVSWSCLLLVFLFYSCFDTNKGLELNLKTLCIHLFHDKNKIYRQEIPGSSVLKIFAV